MQIHLQKIEYLYVMLDLESTTSLLIQVLPLNIMKLTDGYIFCLL